MFGLCLIRLYAWRGSPWTAFVIWHCTVIGVGPLRVVLYFIPILPRREQSIYIGTGWRPITQLALLVRHTSAYRSQGLTLVARRTPCKVWKSGEKYAAVSATIHDLVLTRVIRECASQTFRKRYSKASAKEICCDTMLVSDHRRSRVRRGFQIL